MPTSVRYISRSSLSQQENHSKHMNVLDRIIMFFAPKDQANSIKKGLVQAKEIQEGKVQAKSFEEAIVEL